jgi:hypothetical protein
MIPYITNDHENMNTLLNPSHPRPRSAKRGGQGGEHTHPYTPLKRGFTISPGGRTRARGRGKIDFCKSLICIKFYSIPLSIVSRTEPGSYS